MNKVILVGRTTTNAEQKETNGTRIVNFTLAVQRDKETADFIPCVAFNTTADILVRFAPKGSKIGVEGRFQSRNWEDKNGAKRTSYEVLVERVELLDPKKEEPKVEEPKKVDERTDLLGRTIRDDDLPF